MNLSIGFVTSRTKPEFGWFCESLSKQVTSGDKIEIILIDTHAGQEDRKSEMESDFVDAFIHSGLEENVLPFIHVLPKPTIWAGKHRITKEDWWSKSNSLNTFICLATYPFLVMVDDRCVLTPIWLKCVKEAMNGNYAVCGSYEKRAHMKVENGEIIDQGELLGVDTRTPGLYPFDSWYGGSCALPLEWCLQVNGYPEACDSLGSEDSMFGVLLRNNGFPVRYDSRMRIIEDRTPGEIGGALKRADKNPHLGQRAKSWDIVRMFQNQTTSQNEFDIRNMRDRVLLNGESLSDMPPVGSHFDFYDGQPISEME